MDMMKPCTLRRRNTCGLLHWYLLCSSLRYAPLERHTCHTLCRGCSYTVVIYTTSGNVNVFFRRSATLYHSAIAIYRMPHSPHICLALRCCHSLQYSLRFGYITCLCICFAIIVLYRSETHCPIFTLASTMPSVPHILRCFIVRLQCFLLVIYIVAVLALIPFDITGYTMPSVLHILR